MNALVDATDRFLDALRIYLASEFDQEFQQAAYTIGYRTRESTDGGGPQVARRQLRALIGDHASRGLAASWAALDAEPAYSALPTDTRTEFVAAVAAVLDVFAAQNPGLYGAWNSEPGTNRFGHAIENARAVLYRASVDNPARRDVADAAQHLAVAQAEEADTTSAFHAAIEAGDLEEIARLRPIVAVHLPAQTYQARQVLLDAEAHAAAFDFAPFEERQTRVEKAAVEASRAVEKARAALAAAEARKVAADNLVPATVAATVAAQQQVDTTATARDTHAANHESERLSRVRAFARV